MKKNSLIKEQQRQQIMNIVCAAIATSDKGLKRICDAARKDDPTFPHKCTIMGWLRDSEEFSNQYAHAKELQADHIFDQIIDIADDDSEDALYTEDGKRVMNGEFVQRSKLKVDARKWVVSKLLPKKYGDKMTLAGDPENPLSVMTDEQLLARLESLRK